MPISPFLTYLDNRIKSCSSKIEKAEMMMIHDAISKTLAKPCTYCKWFGHTHATCPVHIEAFHRCRGDGLRHKVRGRISNDLRVNSRLPLTTNLGKRNKPERSDF